MKYRLISLIILVMYVRYRRLLLLIKTKITMRTDGRQRTLDEYDALFSRAGMKLACHHEANGQLISVVEGRTA